MESLKAGQRAVNETWWDVAQRHHSTGFPAAAKELARREAIADAKGVSPLRTMKKSGASKVTKAKLLTLLVEFDPEANDDFSGWEKPDDPSDPTGCITEPAGTVQNGPLHNELPDPATNGSGRDNNTFWVPDFSSKHYNKMIYSKTGLTQRVRPDLNGGRETCAATPCAITTSRCPRGSTSSPAVSLRG